MKPLKRYIPTLSKKEYDLIIVGGGVFGAFATWDATLRGLSVALLEKKDFAHATSANSFRMIHGGIRYLQHLDLSRIRRSVKERRALFRIAPHLVNPIPICIPLYGYGLRGKEILKAGMFLYDLIAFDRNRGIHDRDRQIPRGCFISRQQILELFPGLSKRGLRGGAIFTDGQIYNPVRLVFSVIRSAVNAGADVANYVEVTGFLGGEKRVSGVTARDVLTGEELEIAAKMVLNAAGPWSEQLLDIMFGLKLTPRTTFTRDVCFLLRRNLVNNYAIAIQGKTKDPSAIFNRKQRHLFITPWRDYTAVGVWHTVHTRNADDLMLTKEELNSFIEEINERYDGFNITINDIGMLNVGLVLSGENNPGATNLRYSKKSLIVDHGKEHAIEGLLTIIGARYTTARGDAARAIDLIFDNLSLRSPKCVTELTTVYGGQMKCFRTFLREEISENSYKLTAKTLRGLIHNYGSEYTSILKYVDSDPRSIETIENSNVLKVEVIYAIRDEMAQKLADVVFRRTDLATGQAPSEASLITCANLMATELGWDDARSRDEVDEVKVLLQRQKIQTRSQ